MKKNASNRSNRSKDGSSKKLPSESLTSVSGRSLNNEEEMKIIGEESARSLTTDGTEDESKYLERVEKEVRERERERKKEVFTCLKRIWMTILITAWKMKGSLKLLAK